MRGNAQTHFDRGTRCLDFAGRMKSMEKDSAGIV